jgi:hypothetical protein
MDFEFEVGQSERHTVRYVFDKVWGRATISVDGREVQRHRHLFSIRPIRRYRLTVGDREPHDVLIEKRREMVAAGIRTQHCRVLVDGQVVGEYQG